MKINKALIFLFSFLALLLSACSSSTIVMKPGYDFSKIKRVAVLEFRNSAYYPNSGAMVSQMFAKYMLKAGYNIIERDELDALLRERNLSMSNLLDSDTTKNYGKLLGIDAIITGSIPMVVAEQNYYEAGNPRFIAAQVGVTARMISIETGEVLWVGSDTYDAINTQTAFEYLVSSLVSQLIDGLRESVAKNQALIKETGK